MAINPFERRTVQRKGQLADPLAEYATEKKVDLVLFASDGRARRRTVGLGRRC